MQICVVQYKTDNGLNKLKNASSCAGTKGTVFYLALNSL